MPLHRPLILAHLPVVTLGLVPANVWVFLALQGRDAALDLRARMQSRDSGLEAIELPAYRPFERLQADATFRQALQDGRIVAAAHPRHPAWREARAPLDALYASQFTPRHLLRFPERDPVRMLGAMVLHGDAGHLVGNGRGARQ